MNADDFCDGEWSTRPGNSPPPPETIGSPIGIIVTSTVDKSGPWISGDIVQILLVAPTDGYQGNPGHWGTGIVTSIICSVDQ